MEFVKRGGRGQNPNPNFNFGSIEKHSWYSLVRLNSNFHICFNEDLPTTIRVGESFGELLGVACKHICLSHPQDQGACITNECEHLNLLL